MHPTTGRNDNVCTTERSGRPEGVCSRANIDSVLANSVHCNESLLNWEPSTVSLLFSSSSFYVWLATVLAFTPLIVLSLRV